MIAAAQTSTVGSAQRRRDLKRKYVIAGLALIAALAVVSTAVGGSSLKKLVKKEVTRQLAGKTGAPGTNGINGTNGTNGSPAASAFIGRASGLNTLKANPLVYVSPQGSSTAATAPDSLEMGAPNVAMTARDLHVTADAAAGMGKTQTYEIWIGSIASSVLSCSISGAAQTTCNSGTATGTIPAGDAIALRIFNGTDNPAPDKIEFGWRATTP